MTWIVLFFSAVGAAFVQTLLPGPAWLGGAKWPLLTGVVLYYALQRETDVMLVAAVFAGFLQDALGAPPLGVSACALLLTGLCLSRLRRLVLSDAFITQAFFGFIGSLMVALVGYLLMLPPRAVDLSAGAVLHTLLGFGLEGLVCTPLMFRVIGNLDRATGNTTAMKDVEGTGSELDGFAE